MRLVLLGLIAYACALLITAPAGLLDQGLSSASNGRLRLSEAQGGLWSGAGRLEVRSTSGRALLGEGLRWHVLPGQLLQGRLAIELQLEHSANAIMISLGPGRVEILAADINLPAAALSAAQTKLVPLQLTGEVLLRIKQLAIASGGWTGTVTLQWRHAGSALTKVYPLGDYELELAGQGAAAQIKLVTLSGPLQLDGKGSLSQGGQLAFAAIARIDPNFRALLEPLMRLIAVERGDGSFELQLI